jgi:hypothetical protein
MEHDRKVEDYRGHKLVAALQLGAYRGRAWRDSDVVAEVEGQSLTHVLELLRSRVDQSFHERVKSRSSPPSPDEYQKALQRILPTLTDGHVAMLKAHFRAPGRQLTATQLAEAAGYATYSAANLQYGLVGRALFEQLPVELATRVDGSPIYTWALATAPDHPALPEEEWVWQMRPELARAIEALALHA